MFRPISPRAHGAIDYGLLMMWAGVPHLLGLPQPVRTVFATMGLGQAGLNAVTDQPYALRRIVPFRVHGLIEKYSSPLYVVLPLAAGTWDDRRSRVYFLAAGAVLVANFNLTNWNATSTNA